MKAYRKIIIIGLLVLFSCKRESGKTEEQDYMDPETMEFTRRPQQREKEKEKTKYSFLREYKILDVPWVDSTNFDNHKTEKLLTKEEIRLLGLDQVFPKEYLETEAPEIGISYRLMLSDNYLSYVFFFYFSESELSSTLVNYDWNHRLIDYKTTAMDEIAESLLSVESTIYKDSVVIHNFRYLETPEKETEIFDITKDGKFKARE